MTISPFGLYVHLPYCAYKCPYCDFNAYAVTKAPETDYVEALKAELEAAAKSKEFARREICTVYFGGGTPSLFSAHAIKAVLDITKSFFPGSNFKEVSLEANPGSVSGEYFTLLKEAGVSRVSIGSQSFNETHLKTLGRRHSPSDVIQAIAQARAAGLDNISIDLIFAVPNQTLQELIGDMQQIEKIGPNHVSIYGLTIEPGTPLFQSVERGIVKPVDDDYQAEMYEVIVSTLAKAGYEQYEISNFARNDQKSLHNLSYWDGGDYLGIGAGAHSFVCSYENGQRKSGVRWSNLADPSRYMAQAKTKGSTRAWAEDLTELQLMKEFFYLGLRKSEGVSLQNFAALFGKSAFQQFAKVIAELEAAGFILTIGDHLKLTQSGQLVSDSVFEKLL